MNRRPWMGVTFIAFAFLAATLIYGQTKQKTTTILAPTRGGTAALAQRVELRRAVLISQEERRIEIANDLEFSLRLLPQPSPLRQVCLIPAATPAASIDPHRSLLVHDRETLDAADFSLGRTLTQIATQVALP